ncbi:MAG: DEAD/DEAH box helicase [Planctomycetia bacterium]|nr:DEAD/DEAH box helicase [Planctomycetia bacterium]
MKTTRPIPAPGQIVRVRQRQYLVEEVKSPTTADEATLVRLSCLDDDAQGQALAVLWEAELDAEVLTGCGWEHLAERGFDAPKLFSAYLHTLRWNCVTATNARLFQSPYRAGIRIDAYQIEPLRKALLLPRVNLFIADDVGLGKTIEAALIARELLLRKKVRDIVVACPPSVLPQWRDELEQRFGLVFEVLDKDYIIRIRRERGYGTNPFATHTRFLISHRLLIDEGYAGPMRDWLGDFRPGSLLILDEAHHAAPASGGRYAIDSKITRAIRDLAPRFEHRLFLSATPHNGHSNSFSALLEILDPQRFCRGVPVKGKKLLEDVMVRRLKEDIREVQGGFPKRSVTQIDIDGLPAETPELRLSTLLDQYRQLREQRLQGESKRKQAVAALLVSGLQQRLLSSIEAFARTLRVHRRTVERQRKEQTASAEAKPGLFDLLGTGVGSDDDRADLEADTLQREEDAQFEAATLAAASAQTRDDEVRLLDEMTRIAEEARATPDARIGRLFDWMRQHMCPDLPQLGKAVPGGKPVKWNDTRVLIFTEYEDTLRYLRQQLEAAIQGTDRAEERIEVYHGPTPQAQREEIKRAFNTDPKKHPLRILLATDAGREGINLQTHCADLFHFDVPWNPSRMEQRNGRIDRKLQPRTEVTCYYFVYKQRAEDRVLRALVRKTDTIKRELGSLAQVIEGKLAETLVHGIQHANVARLEREIDSADLERDFKDTVAEELEAARERQDTLREQVDVLRDRLSESQNWLGLNTDHFRAALSCALEMIGAEPMKEVPKQPGQLQFPSLDRRKGGDPSWADTLDTLRAPRKREQTFWDWRRESAIRPIVFDDPGTMTDEVVHLHLEHRVVQRLLGRFIAQGFIHNDLSRACLAQTTDAIPRVILLGRLCLYGAGAARLHEELIPVTARWTDPKKRKGELTPYARDAEMNTLQLLEQSLLKPGQPGNETVLKQLLASAPRDVEELLPHLDRRGNELAEGATLKLRERGDKEAEAMRAILDDQKKRIGATVTKTKDIQPGLFDQEEMRQLEADKRHWSRRLTDIDRELTTEPTRIREVYQVKAQRVEPVGLVYLWPVTG